MIRTCKIHGETEHTTNAAKHLKKGYRWRCKQCVVDAVRKRRRKVKQKAIQYKGGKCKGCGYDKIVYPEVFEFHHRDPSQKEFAISAQGCSRSWDRVKKELDKCDLYCANCHRIHHSNLSDHHYEDYLEEDVKKITYCICGKVKLNRNRFCSPECYQMSTCKVDWNNVNLPKLLKENNNNFCAVGRLLGISDVAVRKHYKKYNN